VQGKNKEKTSVGEGSNYQWPDGGEVSLPLKLIALKYRASDFFALFFDLFFPVRIWSCRSTIQAAIECPLFGDSSKAY